MRRSILLLSAVITAISAAEDAATTTTTTSEPGVLVLTGSQSIITQPTVPTGTYISYTTTIIVPTETSVLESMSDSASMMATANSNGTDTTATTSASVTILVGGGTTATVAANATSLRNSTTTSTSSSATPTNTTPCNNYPELCYRKYSNMTMVAAHNSPFVLKGNAAANQALGVTQQLDDGIRLLQGQTHKVNGTLRYCHTNCDILDAGPIVDYLTTVYNWVHTHPYDVVTILIGNGDYVWVENYTAPLEASGLVRYAYIPPKIPMALNDWPTLAQMILTGKRVVFFMDYMANQGSVPYILDEFSQLWESPFDPTNRSFPCNVQRPPGLSLPDAQNRMYMTNHNLNTELTILDYSLTVPTTTLLNVTNNVAGYGSLGEGAEICCNDYGRPPNFLNVDYYNIGYGSVFEVAAKWNNVTYTAKCCGLAATSGAMAWRALGGGFFGSWLWTLSAAAAGVAVLIV